MFFNPWVSSTNLDLAAEMKVLSTRIDPTTDSIIVAGAYWRELIRRLEMPVCPACSKCSGDTLRCCSCGEYTK